MKNKIGNYSISEDRSTVYYNNTAIFQSDFKSLSRNLFLAEGQVCFDDRKTRSIYRAIEYGVECIYSNVSLFSIQNLLVYYGNSHDGKTVFLRLDDNTDFTKLLVSSNDYSGFSFENGYYLNEHDFEILMSSFPSHSYCLLSKEGIYDFPSQYSDVFIHYNYAGDRVTFFFDDEKRHLKVKHKKKEKILYKQPKKKEKLYNGTVRTWYPKLTIRYTIIDDDIVRIDVGSTVVYYDNHMPTAYKDIQTSLKDYKDTISNYLFYPDDESKKAFALKKLFETSGLDTVISSNIKNDSSVNHLVRLGDKRKHLAYSLINGSFNASQFIILGVKLIKLIASTEYAIKNRMWDVNGYNLHSYFSKEEVYPREIEYLKDYYGISDGELFWFLKKEYLDVLDSPKQYNVGSANFSDFQELMDDILLDFGYYESHPSKWKNEFSLYRFIKDYVPDTVFQAQPTWLRPQSLDIFIESKSIGIEYQGIQHFQPIDYFGGEEGYLEIVQRDEKKKQICKEQGVQLLYWNYQEEVTKLSVKEFLQKYKIIDN